MLQNLRDNLKGAVAVVVVMIFIVPLVLFGVEQLFVGSVGGTDVATVNGEGVNRRELERELILEKNRLQQQRNLEAGDPQLEDSALIGPVLDRIVNREALVQAAQEGGMGAATEILWEQIRGIEAFQIDGKFDRELFKERISYLYTPATFLEANARDYLLTQMNQGVVKSTFVTEQELALMASITQQKRTFFTVDIPKEELDDIEVSDEELRGFYDENSQQFLEPESVVVEYVEISVDNLAKSVSVTEEEIKAIYEEEVAEFVAEPKHIVAHILLEGKDGQQEKVTSVSTKLADGEAFDALAKEYSDDLGSKSKGGMLGEMIDGAYPDEFVDAVGSLEVGGVSGPVETDAGIHFIKLVSISNAEAPTFDERKDAISNQLARQKAQELFIAKSNTLDEKAFGADSLQGAAEAVGVSVKKSKSFTRRGGEGIAANQKVVDAAFADDVLKQSHNSAVINLEGDRAVVIRLNKHQPELLKPFDSVKEQIKQRVLVGKQNERMQEKAKSLIEKLESGAEAEVVAKDSGYTYVKHENVTRIAFEGNPSVSQKAFSLPRPLAGAVVYDSANIPGSGLAVIGLAAVNKGELSELEDAQRKASERQLAFQLSRAEMSAYEKAIIQTADIEKSE